MNTTKAATFILLTFTCMAFLSSLFASPLEVGATAPAITVPDDTGAPLSLAGEYEKGPVLVYFYPKADTPGCTRQACNLRDNFEALTDAGVIVLGVSMDSPEAQAAFKAKYDLPFRLLADTEGKVCEGFGVPRKGRFASRQSFLVKDGKVAWRDLSAAPKTQAQDALAALDTPAK